MGQLRGLLRGIAHHSGAGPAEVLRGLDEAIAQMHADAMATATIARFERAESAAGRGPGAAVGVLAVAGVAIGTYVSHLLVERAQARQRPARNEGESA